VVAGVAGLLGVFAVPLGALPAPAGAQAPTPGAPTSARLTGEFEMLGRVTVAKNVKGERRGQRAKRAWTFTSPCAAGQCPTIRLVRYRAHGVDRLVLELHSPGYYTGKGRFYVPARCAGHYIRKAESVPFTVTVRVTAAQIVNGVDIATMVSATYTNRSRKNLTRCVAFPGHDAAVYDGLLLTLPAAPTGGVNDRSPVGS
jgi:hypothetical protein